MDILLSPSALKLVGAVDPNRVTRHDLSQRQAMPRSSTFCAEGDHTGTLP